MNTSIHQLLNTKRQTDFLVAVDSDGCVFDTMEIKHKECFIPQIINIWGLQAVSKYARETSEFVNLYSSSRGINRFPGLVKTIELLSERKEVKKRLFNPPDISRLKKWVESETKLGNPSLEKEIAKTKDPILEKALLWSQEVNKAVEKIVRGVPPFPYVEKSLQKANNYADMIVVSSTPIKAIKREWEEHGIAKYVKMITGQETGTKKDCIANAKKEKYADHHIIMIGDALGDMNAAKANNALFYPILPGNEDFSWQRFFEESFDKFINGTYAGDYESKIICEFEKLLPSVPPWKI